MEESCYLYYKALENEGIQPTFIPEIDGFRVYFGGVGYTFRGGQTPFNDLPNASTSSNKYCMNRMLHQAGIPVPEHIAITKEQYDSGEWDLKKLSFPVVVKPTWDTSCGKGVLCNIKDKGKLIQVLEAGFIKYNCMSIESYKSGLDSYRILVFYDKVIGLVRRYPSQVVGDGRHNINQLIDIANQKRQKHLPQLPLGNLSISEETLQIFEELGVSAETVPAEGMIIPLRYVCNSTFGGSMSGLPTSAICRENAELAVKAAKALCLNIVGFDVICEDLSIPFEKSRGYFIEANCSPDLSIHEHVTHGPQNHVSTVIIKSFLRKHSWKHKMLGWFFRWEFYFMIIGLVAALWVAKTQLNIG